MAEGGVGVQQNSVAVTRVVPYRRRRATIGGIVSQRPRVSPPRGAAVTSDTELGRRAPSRTVVNLDLRSNHARGFAVVRITEGQIPLPIQVFLLDIGKDQDGPTHFAVPAQGRRGKSLIVVVVVVDCQTDLLEVVGAPDAGGGLADFLYSR